MKLSSTSALVLLWAGQDFCKSSRAKQYMSQLDLDEGITLYKQCQDVWPHYDEIIRNRKYGILNLIEKCCSDKIDGQQLIIVGAGLDPLGIEVTQKYSHVSVFELDKENMRLKSGLHTCKENTSGANIHFVEIDVLDTASLMPCLRACGWDEAKPTGLVMEGISYYLPGEAICSLAQIFHPDWTIFEFLKHDTDIAAGRREIPRMIFDTIADHCALPHIRRYDYSEVETLFAMPAIDRYSMKRLEKMRTGMNKFFETEDSGWIEVCLLRKNQAQ